LFNYALKRENTMDFWFLLHLLFRIPHGVMRPREGFIRTYRHDFEDGRGCSHLGSIFRYQDKLWILRVVKENPERKKRDLLAWHLGNGWLNIPETRSLSWSEYQVFAGMVPYPKPPRDGLYRVRLAQDYQAGRLTVGIPDKAMAGELVFSAWILRRDAHSGNRAFVGGVPLFFDFEQGFNGEFHEAYKQFFMPGPDSGYVPNWRLYPIRPRVQLTTHWLRRRAWENAPLTLQPVRDIDKFWEYTSYYRRYVSEMPRSKWKQAILQAGFRGDRAREVLEFLESSASALDGSMERIRTIMERPLRA
jgi:hypothetical protein